MRLKFLVCMAGTDANEMSFVRKPGDVALIDDTAEAVRLVEAGFAVPVPEAPETAVAAPAEARAEESTRKGGKKS